MERENTPEDVRAELRREAGGVECLWGGGGEDSRKEELIWEGEWKSGHLDKKKGRRREYERERCAWIPRIFFLICISTFRIFHLANKCAILVLLFPAIAIIVASSFFPLIFFFLFSFFFFLVEKKLPLISFLTNDYNLEWPRSSLSCTLPIIS
jgi:hypothetical protein